MSGIFRRYRFHDARRDRLRRFVLPGATTSAAAGFAYATLGATATAQAIKRGAGAASGNAGLFAATAGLNSENTRSGNAAGVFGLSSSASGTAGALQAALPGGGYREPLHYYRPPAEGGAHGVAGLCGSVSAFAQARPEVAGHAAGMLGHGAGAVNGASHRAGAAQSLHGQSGRADGVAVLTQRPRRQREEELLLRRAA